MDKNKILKAAFELVSEGGVAVYNNIHVYRTGGDKTADKATKYIVLKFDNKANLIFDLEKTFNELKPAVDYFGRLISYGNKPESDEDV